MVNATLPRKYVYETNTEEFEEKANREEFRRISGIVGKVCELKSPEGNPFIAKMRIDHGNSSTVVGRRPSVMGQSSLYLSPLDFYLGAMVDILYWKSTGPRKGTQYVLNRDTGRVFVTPIITL